ncbi:hypothetical protein PARHAE_03650 [Paracoccus haematequi]|uniref:Uncharacterized protein n=1 Tax=Paracoccus haematequi TaxID=2491866 RepID=A0A447ISI7_9RHOB|nr:hypothetical protein [Paracoccus haematequi]VDS10435.1 hypothetical protein PARHAE_03650 [Paracoccus haematequi]
MRLSRDVLTLPVPLRQQLLAMPLTADERQDAARAISKAINPPAPNQLCRDITKNAPQPDGLRGV